MLTMLYYQYRYYALVYVFVQVLCCTFLNARSFGSLHVEVGKAAALTCFDQTWPNLYTEHYVELFFQSNSSESNFMLIARYIPLHNLTMFYSLLWEKRTNFLNSGIVHLRHMTLHDEGIYECRSQLVPSYLKAPDIDTKWSTTIMVYERSYASLVGAILGAVVFIGLAVGCGYAVYKRKGKADTTRSTGASLSRSVRSKSSGHRKRVTSGWAGVVDESQDVVDKSQNVLYKNKIAFIESTAAPSKGYIYMTDDDL